MGKGAFAGLPFTASTGWAVVGRVCQSRMATAVTARVTPASRSLRRMMRNLRSGVLPSYSQERLQVRRLARELQVTDCNKPPLTARPRRLTMAIQRLFRREPRARALSALARGSRRNRATSRSSRKPERHAMTISDHHRAGRVHGQRTALLTVAIVLLWVSAGFAQKPEDKEAERQLTSARQAFTEKNYPVAAARFRDFVARFGTHKEAPVARYHLAFCLLHSPEKDYGVALDLLQKLTLLRDLP